MRLPVEALLSLRSAPPQKTKTQIILYAERHTAMGERVALGALIGLFRTEGRKGSPIVRGYLHTNGIMVIRDAPLEALEVRRALFPACSCSAGVFGPIIFSGKEENESPRASGSHVLSLPPTLPLLFLGCCTELNPKNSCHLRRSASLPAPVVVGYFASVLVKRG